MSTDVVCRLCGSSEWSAEDAEMDADVRLTATGRVSIDVSIASGAEVVCDGCGESAEEVAIPAADFKGTGNRDLEEDDRAREALIGKAIWTTDHVRRNVQSWASSDDGWPVWIDEYGDQNAIEAIDAVIHGGQSISLGAFIAQAMEPHRYVLNGVNR